MRVSIRDKGPLSEISPAALSAYARATGWTRTDNYGDSSDVYVSDGLPEIILPRTQRLGDYANVVSQLIDIFADVAGTDELSLYRDLVTADRDVIRVRAAEGVDGAVSVSDGIDLVCGAHDMILAAACSLHNPRAVYRPGANIQAMDYVRNLRLGQTEQGSFVVTMLTPVVPPTIQQSFIQDSEHNEDPIERKMTRRLVSALRAARHATEGIIGGNVDAFLLAVDDGVSANLCEALVKLIEPFEALDVSLTWARTYPMKTVREVVRFAKGDAPIFRQAARLFRDREPRPNVRLTGPVHRLIRYEQDLGTITLRAYIDEQMKSVVAVLSQSDYARAIQAHKEKAPIVVEGDLDRHGQRWHLLNPRVVAVIPQKDMQEEGE